MPSSNIETLLQLIRKHLLESSTILSLVDGRCYTAHFFDFDNQTVQMPLIIIDVDGGDANYSSATQLVKMHVYAYSRKSQAESLKIYQAAYERLNASDLRIDGISLTGTAVETSRPITGYNDQIRAYFSRGSYRVFTAG